MAAKRSKKSAKATAAPAQPPAVRMSTPRKVELLDAYLSERGVYKTGVELRMFLDVVSVPMGGYSRAEVTCRRTELLWERGFEITIRDVAVIENAMRAVGIAN